MKDDKSTNTSISSLHRTGKHKAKKVNQNDKIRTGKNKLVRGIIQDRVFSENDNDDIILHQNEKIIFEKINETIQFKK